MKNKINTTQIQQAM